MKEGIDSEPKENAVCSKAGCESGCGGSGLCPGVALFLAWVAGAGVTFLSGREWLGWAVGILLGLVLITGAWKWRPQKG